ncbi:FHA domain-containing protein [Streptomyces sp. E11-3]|uniref:FHA domain-containing protein n=1 Tax=Streptomyces sp. E11-3 TaxID=3110112 RepID=UPI0039812A63
MFSIIVVPMADAQQSGQIRLEPGEVLRFGRALPTEQGARQLSIAHLGVSRKAGTITAEKTFWTLSNLSRVATYVVENPEGAGEHIKVAPGRLGAPIPFEFSRVVLPAAEEFLTFDVWAPRHDYVDHDAPDAEPTATGHGPGTSADSGPRSGSGSGSGYPSTVLGFPLDHSKRYFMVLAALCEPRLRGAPHAPAPTADQVVQRLRPVWPEVSRTAVNWSIDYLAVKLHLKPGPGEEGDPGTRLHGKKEALVSLALRFNLVREDHLAVLTAPPAPHA